MYIVYTGTQIPSYSLKVFMYVSSQFCTLIYIIIIIIIIIFHSQDLLSRDVLLMFPSLRRYHHNLRLHHGCPLGRPVGDFLLTDGLPIFCLDRDRLPSWHYQPHNENPVDLVLNPISSYGAH